MTPRIISIIVIGAFISGAVGYVYRTLRHLDQRPQPKKDRHYE